jgi:toxin ParE1/3/4
VYTVVASAVFKHSLSRFIAFLSKKYGEEFALAQKKSLRENIEKTLCSTPYIAPISDRLLSLGISEYRQWSLDKHNIIYFKINEEKQQIELLAIMDSRQSIQKLLYDVMLLT